MEGDANYFIRRANEERLAAMRAAHPSARQAHLKMAELYDKLANGITEYQLQSVQSVS